MLDLRSLAVLAALAPCAAGQSLHVPGQFPTIQAAINAAHHGDTVIVANGVYTGAGNRDLDFGGKNITVRSRNGAANCIIDCQATPQDPYRGFLFENGETRAAVVEGFTIRNAATLNGAIADQFNGGAIRIRLGASPTIRNCVFRDNTAGCWGGGVYVGFGGNPLIVGCVFEGNSADDGGGFFSWQGPVTEIRSSVFIRNSVSNAGGAVAEFGGGVIHMTNCTIVQNTGATWSSGGFVDFGNASTVTSSIVWGNSGTSQVQGSRTAVRFSNVQGGHPGEGNMDREPRFLPDGYHLHWSSPCLGAGSPTTTPVPGETDIDGEARIQNERIEMGADEVRAGVLGGWLDRAGTLVGR